MHASVITFVSQDVSLTTCLFLLIFLHSNWNVKATLCQASKVSYRILLMYTTRWSPGLQLCSNGDAGRKENFDMFQDGLKLIDSFDFLYQVNNVTARIQPPLLPPAGFS